MRHNYRPWTETEDRYLIFRHRDTIREQATALGRAYGDVAQRRIALNATRYARANRLRIQRHQRNPSRSMRRCSFPGCDKPHFANDYCVKHNSRLRRHGDPSVVLKSGPKPASAGHGGACACGKPSVVSTGECMACYQRRRRAALKEQKRRAA